MAGACSRVFGTICPMRTKRDCGRHPAEAKEKTEVLEKRESKSRPNAGIVSVKTTGYNQEGKVVITFKRTIMVYKEGQAPHIARLAPEG